VLKEREFQQPNDNLDNQTSSVWLQPTGLFESRRGSRAPGISWMGKNLVERPNSAADFPAKQLAPNTP
jgi:hypothetical protein